MAFRGGFLKVFLAGIALATLIPAGHGAFAAVCSTKAPAVTVGNFDVVYDTTDLAMKACVNGTWVVMSSGGGGATALTGLSDVLLTSPTNGQVLTYNGSQWVNGAGASGGITALTGAVTASGTGSVAATIASGAVTYAKIQNVANGKLLGRSTAGAGIVEEITVGSGLSLSGGTLSASGGPTSSGTAGYVQISGGSGAFSSDSTAGGQLFWDSTNHRLGIGTAAPASVLHVQGPGSGATTLNIIKLGAGGWDTPKAQNAALDGGVKLHLFDSPTQKVQIGMNGNAQLWFNDSGTASGGFGFYTSTDNTTDPTAKFVILPGGNVGVGATNPSAKLEVAGAVKIVDGTQGAGKVLTSDASGLASWSGGDVINTTILSTGAFPMAAGTAVPANGFYDLGSMSVTTGVYMWMVYNCAGQLTYSTGSGNSIQIVGAPVIVSSSTWTTLNNVPGGSCGIFYTGVFKVNGTGTASMRVSSYSGSVLVTPGPGASAFSASVMKIY